MNFLLSSLIPVPWSRYIHGAPQFCSLHCCSLCPRSTGILVSSISNDTHLKRKRAWCIFNFIYCIIQCIPDQRAFLFLLTLVLIWWSDWVPWVVTQLSGFQSLMGVEWPSTGRLTGCWMIGDGISGDRWLAGPQLRQRGRLDFVCPIFQEACWGFFTGWSLFQDL